jgi:tRNA (guanine-N7-)-methyltransferase
VRRSPRLPPEELAPYLLETPNVNHGEHGEHGGKRVEGSFPVSTVVHSLLDWRAVFGNGRPAEVEVGFGKGLFLITAAQACPDVNFLGVEIVRKYQLFTATRLAKRGLRNVRVACADARLFFRAYLPAGSVQAVHVYFPDPWWKKRHHKRRLFTPEFARECVRVLRPGGLLHAATDVEEYSHLMREAAAQPSLRPLPPPEAKDPTHDLDYLTNFERKFRKQGKPIYRFRWEKSEVPS